MSLPYQAKVTSYPSPVDDWGNVLLGGKAFVTFLDTPYADAIMQLPLPGIIIFVHGVNSDGEWYSATEEGLCQGLNERLKRCNEHMAFPTPEGGQLTSAAYAAELTPDGYLNPKRSAKNFIQNDDGFSPVIRFRWGYKANSQELRKFGDSIYLNEHGYWGGGPFANGCTALPDLWSEGLSDELFLWMRIEHLNPVPGRVVYPCPPRPYFVLAALRLAKLIEAIRKKQADVPITLVCHSQGNMVGIAAAFLGDQFSNVSDVTGKTARCVADSYVLCNPPYSLLKSNFTENWMQGDMTDPEGGTGRQTGEARAATLRAFFDIIRQPASTLQSAGYIDKFMANKMHQFDTTMDREKYGLRTTHNTCCRVTLYCTPHDQVISAVTVQGIGWRGMSTEEIERTGGRGVFSQRVFAHGFEVGSGERYHYWENHYRKLHAGDNDFWFPRSPKAKYDLGRGLKAEAGSIGKVFTIFGAPVMYIITRVLGTRVNALPDKNWWIPLDAPNLPKPFAPQSVRLGQVSEQFDEGRDSPSDYRDQQHPYDSNDPYHDSYLNGGGGSMNSKKHHNVPMGNMQSEASIRYEDHARLRMMTKRAGMSDKEVTCTQEDDLSAADKKYLAWRKNNIQSFFKESATDNATDHSTIMTNSMHAQQALAYDVAIGVSHLLKSDMHHLRIAADWRLLMGAPEEFCDRKYLEYFDRGTLDGRSVMEWARLEGSDGRMPVKIVDRRENPPPLKPEFKRQ
ncbi:hypothetical protein [Massilia sp. Root351]|jgi:pimeloyl-ACP methyl ester carboxylesterase|uniref:T6SS effector phospholipase Tle3 domain-containing protein n=1 Tax=Massilia sp. Root351 TaxID=1736522 RepID=UPI0009E8F989|nr:hypothetical protein [Massilia sp. Root351]